MYGSGSKNLYTRDLRSSGQQRADSELNALRPTSMAIDGENSKGGTPSNRVGTETDDQVPFRRFFNNFNLKDYFFHNGGYSAPARATRQSYQDDAFTSPRDAPDYRWEGGETREMSRSDNGGRQRGNGTPPVAVVLGGGAGGYEIDPSEAVPSPWLLIIWLLVMAASLQLTAYLSMAYSFPIPPPETATHQHQPEARLKSMLLLLLLSIIIFNYGGVGIRVQAFLQLMCRPNSRQQRRSDAWGGNCETAGPPRTSTNHLMFLPLVVCAGLFISAMMSARMIGMASMTTNVASTATEALSGAHVKEPLVAAPAHPRLRRRLIDGAMQATTVLPPAYLSVPGFRQCLGTMKKGLGGYQLWCFPVDNASFKPKARPHCEKKSWKRLRHLHRSGRLSACSGLDANSSGNYNSAPLPSDRKMVVTGADGAIGAQVISLTHWLLFAAASVGLLHNLVQALRQGARYFASYCASAMLFPCAVVGMGMYTVLWADIVAERPSSNTGHGGNTHHPYSLLLSDPLALQRLWWDWGALRVWAAYLSCYSHFPTTISTACQAILCGIVAHGLGLYGITPLFAITA